jgi:hypothetical protein
MRDQFGRIEENLRDSLQSFPTRTFVQRNGKRSWPSSPKNGFLCGFGRTC